MDVRRSARLASREPQSEQEVDLRGFYGLASNVEQTLRDDEKKSVTERCWPAGTAHIFHQRCEVEASLRRQGSGVRTSVNQMVPFSFEERKHAAEAAGRLAPSQPSSTASGAPCPSAVVRRFGRASTLPTSPGFEGPNFKNSAFKASMSFLKNQ